jgi:AraC-like DNA-binding protein/ligand-binding sensor protein
LNTWDKPIDMEPSPKKSLDGRSLAALTSSQLFHDYQRAFEAATGLPLTLSSPSDLAHAGPRSGTDVPFCNVMSESSAACNACQQLHESLEQGAHKASHTLTCFAGLCETAIPVRAGERLIAFLHTGQVMTRQPTKARFNRVAAELLKWGSEVDLKRAEDAWFATRVLSQEQYAGVVKLITIFATHLGACGRLLEEEIEPKEPEGITKARAYIGARSAEELTLHEVAKVANMSANHFSERFKEITGIRFVEYVARTRVEKACHLLQNTSAPVTEVAYDVGFQSLSQFNRAFRQLTGQTPSTYRSALRAKA